MSKLLLVLEVPQRLRALIQTRSEGRRTEMLDPLRGEMTSRFVQQANLDWAARERLARLAKPIIPERKRHWPEVEAFSVRLSHWRRKPHVFARHRLAD